MGTYNLYLHILSNLKNQMLGFTHNSRSSNNQYSLQFQEQYQPITITNAGSGKQLQVPQRIQSKKKLIPTHNQNKNKPKKSIQRTQKPTKMTTDKWAQNRPAWNSQATNLFDKNIKINTLAAQQRQYRAQSRIKQNPKNKQKQQNNPNTNTNTKILTKQQELHRKKIQIAAQQQQRQIQRLKQLIQKQRQQKQKNDFQYQVKKRKIQAQRNKLIQLQKQIQKQGPKAIKQIREKVNQIHQVPDRIRVKQSLDQEDPRKQATRKQFQYAEMTQTYSLANQKNIIRQQQLQYLVDQRQKNYKQYQKNTLGYTPTLIPLLSRASYKIISTQISSLVELFIDDLLQQQVYLLQAIELQTKAQMQKQKQKQIFKDYVDKLQNFVDSAQIIENRIGKYSKMKFEDIYKHPNRLMDTGEQRNAFKYQGQYFMKLQLNLSANQVEEVHSRVSRFKKLVNAFKQYQPETLRMFQQLTQEAINQAIQKLAKELDNGAGQFVNIVFRSEFD